MRHHDQTSIEPAVSRRRLLTTAFTASLISPMSALAAIKETDLLISAVTDRQGKHWAICIDDFGQEVSKISLPARAHQVLKQPAKSMIAIVGRRPGMYILIASIRSGKAIKRLKPKTGFHFYGHALYTRDGRYLITSENHIESGQGYLFVRDSDNDYRITQYYPSHGIGPHELRLSSDNETLIVANGGILTHPDKGRAKLNLDTMSPSLAYISLGTGVLLEQAMLPKEFHQLSIRHFDINDRDEVLVGMQYQGDKTDQVPLVASHRRGEALKPLWAPEEINYAMKHYCGSVCFDPSGQVAAISSPKGNLITFWDLKQKTFLTSVRCKDGCGLASKRNNEFVISSGYGKVYGFNTLNRELTTLDITLNDNVSWDNHLLSV